MTWLLTIEARDAANAPVTLRFSDGAYDSPDDALYWPRIQQPGLYRDGLYAGDLVRVDRSGFGETTLLNADGGLDYLADYAVDGRAAVLSRAEGDTLAEILRGTVAGLTFDGREISVRLREPQALLDTAHPHETYAGDNVLPDGLEGTADDIAGQVKPRVYGDVRNAEPVMVNTSRVIYQVSARDDCTIAAVYDQGVALTPGPAYASLDALQATAPAAGEWRAWRGYVRLGDASQGTVTVDASTAAVGAGAVMAALASEAGYTLDAADTTALDAVGAVGLYIVDSVTTAALLDRLAVSVGGFWRIDAAGQLRAWTMAAPAAAVAVLEDYQIQSISRAATGAGSNGLPVYRVTVRGDRVESTQSELAGSVSAERRARLANAYREAVANRPAARERHPLADDLTIETDLRALADAQRLADRLADLVSVRRDRVTVDARLAQTQRLTIGDTVTIRTPRRGYADGRDMLVIGRQFDARAGLQTLELWG